MSSKAPKVNKGSFLVALILSVLVVFIGLFIMSKKQDLDFDEVGSFGLANNTYQLDIEDYKIYTGEELLLKYAAVKSGEEFNVKNVFFNQTMDTHPPIYYLILNFVCSLRKNTFSMWYGLIINLILMVVLFWEMRYVFDLVISDKNMSTILSLISFFTYGFINELVFIRMYVLLSVISLGFAILIINAIRANASSQLPKQQKNQIIFLIKFFSICVLGILTQYHFAVFAFYFSLVFAIYLIQKKEIKLLCLTILSGILAISVSFAIFPGIINHIFGKNSLHALNGEQERSLSAKFYGILLTIKRSFFGNAIYFYFAVLVLLIVIVSINLAKANKKTSTSAKTNKANISNVSNREQSNNNFIKSCIVNYHCYFIILLCSIYYYIVISLTVKYTFARYLYNIYPFIIVAILAPIYLLLKNIKPNLKYLTIVMVLILVIGSRFKEEPFSLNLKTKEFSNFLNENKDTKILSLYTTIDKNGRENTVDTSLWKLQRPVYTFRNMEKITFVDMSKNRDVLYFKTDQLANDDKLFLLIYSGENDDEVIGAIMQSNNYNSVNKIIENTYYHMYLLTR